MVWLRMPILQLVISCLLLFVLSNCDSGSRSNQAEITRMTTLSDSGMKARIYCSTCHAFPGPELLDRKTWSKHVLPRMGYFLGIFPDTSTRKNIIEKGYAGELVAQKHIFPEKQVLPDSIWQQIVDYYLTEAPIELPTAESRTISRKQDRFKVHKPGFKLIPPSTTMVRINNNSTIFVGDAHSRALYQFDRNLNLLNIARAQEGPVWLNEADDAFLLTVMGSFSPTDMPSGFLMALAKNKNTAPLILIDSLQRPVHTAMSDLDHDGDSDLVICEYAKWTSSFGWWENDGNHQFTKHILRDKPGATKSLVHDFDGNGYQDIITLFAQGDEGIFIYYNKGEGKFEEKKVLEFSPSHGSTGFQLHDFNQDDLPDIIYTAGDNADFPPVLKYYHGIYFFSNQGDGTFKEEHFYPLNGAYGAALEDFDLDGDLDVAAISFFPDYQQHPEESFLYLENQGGFNFVASTLPDPTIGRWIVIDSGDLDQDGDADLILGSLTFEVVPENGLVDKWVESGIPFIVLENLTL